MSSPFLHPSVGLSCLCCPHSASRGPGVPDMDPALCAKMALQMRHTIPPLGAEGSMWLSQKKASVLSGTHSLPNATSVLKEHWWPCGFQGET